MAEELDAYGDGYTGSPGSVMDAGLALFPGWQFGPKTPEAKIRAEDGFGKMSEVLGAPLRSLEFDVLSWLFSRFYRQGCLTVGVPPNGIVRFTLYEITRAFAEAKMKSDRTATSGPGEGGTNNELIREALESLKAAVVTLTGVDPYTGEPIDRIISKVNIIRSYSVMGQLALHWDDSTFVGAMRDETIEVRFEEWITDRLLSGALVFDWMIQRRLGGHGKRLWVYLEARSPDFKTMSGGYERLTLDVDRNLFNALNIKRKRPRDDTASLAGAVSMILERDPRYIKEEDGLGDYTSFNRRAKKLTIVRKRRDDTMVIEGPLAA